MATETPPLLAYTIAQGAVPTEDPARTVVLVHGFPDSPVMWQPTVAHLIGRGERVISLALPGFEEGAEPGAHPTFDTTVARIHATLAHTGALGATLIGHDWGAIFLYQLLRQHPDAAGRLVTLEIGAGPRSPWLTLFVLLYHGLLVLAHTLGAGLGDRLMRGLCRLFPRPDYPGALQPAARHGWLYRQAWREGSRDGAWPLYFRNGIARWTPRPTLPVLFLYGQDGARPLRFHTQRWRADVTAHHPASRAEGLPGGHWCLLEHPDAFHAALDRFLDRTQGAVPVATPSLAEISTS